MEEFSKNFLLVLEWIGDEPFRLFAALCIVVAAVVFMFFRNEGPFYKLIAIVLLFGGVGAIGYAFQKEPPSRYLKNGTDDIDVVVPAKIEPARLVDKPVQFSRNNTEDCIRRAFSGSTMATVCVSNYIDQTQGGGPEFGVRSLVDDHTLPTAWLSDNQQGSNAYIWVEFDSPTSFSQVIFENGHAASRQQFIDYSAVKELSWATSSGRKGTIALQRSNGVARFIPDDEYTDESWIRFEIEELHRGDRFDIFGLSNLDFSIS